MRKRLIFWLAAGMLFISGCQKELSIEGSNTPSTGSLQNTTSGDCLPKTVNGIYVAGTTLGPAVNTITVQVNVTATGSYIITTDTVNGYYFRVTGTFTALGLTNVTLRGNGTPSASGVNNFVVSYNGTSCSIAVTVLPVGSGPGVFSLVGSPGTCANISVNGGYALGVPLSTSNTVTLSVNVTTIGSYNINTTPIGGMTFSGSGTFTITGPQNVTLTGSGTPTTLGTNTIPVTAGSSNCSFIISVNSGSIGTLGGGPGLCTPVTVFGTYAVATPLTAVDSIQIQISVTTGGVYNITSNAVNGFNFSGTGMVPIGANQTITLYGSGTPISSGPQTFTLSYGASTCTFVVNVLSSDYFPRTTNSNWSYEWNDNANDSLLRVVISQQLTAAGNTYSIFMPNDGTTPGLDSNGNYTAGYYRKLLGDYFERFNYGTFIGYDNPGWDEYIMLKDNVPVNTNWKTKPSGFPGTVSGTAYNIRFSYTILQKDVPFTVTASTGSTTYQNVIVVQEKIEIETGPGTWVDATSALDYYGKSYYARGIGLILFEAYNGAGTRTDWQELRRYQVF